MKTESEYIVSILTAAAQSKKDNDHKVILNELQEMTINIALHEVKEIIEDSEEDIGRIMTVLLNQRRRFDKICKKCNQILGCELIDVSAFDSLIQAMHEKDVFYYYISYMKANGVSVHIDD
jgi:tRNA nucleotidyltransferase (CCA-adding enzyme)